jgi:hypothetical protein
MKARFELHPQASDVENPTLGLRFLETLTPVKCILPDYKWSISEPHPGQLLSRKKRAKHSMFVPWTYSLAHPGRFAGALQQFLAERALEKIKYGV